jgi:putative ABC transport system permease protein
MLQRLGQSLRLATRDYLHEWRVSICFVLALAAVLGPMLVLFGLKFGIVGTMLEELIEDPTNRELRPISSGQFDRTWIEAMHRRPDVAFIIPKTRSIAASMDLRSAQAASIVQAELMPTDRGDPLLPAGMPSPQSLDQIILSSTTAEKLGAAVGDRIDGSVARRYQGQLQREHLPLQVIAIAPPTAFARDGIFAHLHLVEALEDYRDGRAVPELGWTGTDPTGTQRTYPGFRLYARSIYDVAGLRDAFAALGVEVSTRAADIAMVQRMDRNLSAVYWAIAVIGLAGFSLSLGASLWANVDRKRKELSVLRLVGFRTGDIVWFPAVQAFYTAVGGWLLAVAIYYGAAQAINDMLSGQLGPGQQVCRLLPEHLLIALGLTLGSAVFSAVLAGIRSARIEPSEGLREL